MAYIVFWLATAAVIIVATLNSRRNVELKHETIRAMLEKGEKVDESVLQTLLKPNDPYKTMGGKPGDGYRAMRVIGTLLLFLAPGLALLLILAGYSQNNHTPQVVGIGVGSLIALVGAGLHFATRYVDRPPGK
jgi:hypothetical protein